MVVMQEVNDMIGQFRWQCVEWKCACWRFLKNEYRQTYVRVEWSSRTMLSWRQDPEARRKQKKTSH